MQSLSLHGPVEKPESRAADQEKKNEDTHGIRCRLAGGLLYGGSGSHAQMSAVINGCQERAIQMVCRLYPGRRDKHKMRPGVGVATGPFCTPADEWEYKNE